MECDNSICSFHDETMTDNCSKGEPPDVENCTLLNFRKSQEKSEADVRLNNLLSAILKEAQEGLELASSQAAAEVLGGNIVKENYWRGEMSAYQRIKSIFESST